MTSLSTQRIESTPRTRAPWLRRAAVLVLALALVLAALPVDADAAPGSFTKVDAQGQRYRWTPGGC